MEELDFLLEHLDEDVDWQYEVVTQAIAMKGLEADDADAEG